MRRDTGVVDGLVLVSELFSSEKLAELRSRGLSPDEIEYWMNLFSVDGFLEGVPGASYESACGVAHVIAAAWTAKAQGLSPATTAAAWVIADQSSGDVCVTLSRSASAKPPVTDGAF